ncbi:MAG: hypothetical protein KDE20_18005 [Caldilineaceae bacterium]|nr:hypothetical protein [Caldilineaceae bacterium]
MSEDEEKKKVFRCRLCGQVVARHDDGYHHWLECLAKRAEAQVATR